MIVNRAREEKEKKRKNVAKGLRTMNEPIDFSANVSKQAGPSLRYVTLPIFFKYVLYGYPQLDWEKWSRYYNSGRRNK